MIDSLIKSINSLLPNCELSYQKSTIDDNYDIIAYDYDNKKCIKTGKKEELKLYLTGMLDGLLKVENGFF